jgi:hypothetical protein
METKTLNQWMALWGYRWAPHKEQLLKGEITESQASAHIHELERQGAVVSNRG